ncbi:serine O-acetyltransferase [Clostridium intestinale URNW]|uniref:Serine acetyltransferase n=2 Tax=Clostridium intestinale TaxID=36845 RepID=U2Q0A0_9CLOT|nr:serine O-acetyltransferase [Clostridium intestinale URNW]
MQEKGKLMLNFNSIYEKAIYKNLKRYKKNKINRLSARLIAVLLRIVFNCDICLGAIIKKNVRIPHAVGIVIGSTAVIEEGVIIMPNVVIGASKFPPDLSNASKRHATIKENCLLGANSVIVGNITIGKNSIIAAGAVVTKDIPENSTVVGHNILMNKV